MKVYGLFLLSSTASSVSASLKPLGTVFSVSVDSKTSSGCQKYFEANPKKPGKALNLAWQQIYEMNEAALKVLDDDNYESDEEIRRLATRFFGIKPKRTASGMGSKAVVKEAIPIAGDDLDKLNSVKHYYSNLAKLLNGEQLHPTYHDYEKFHLSCGGDFTDLQTETDMLESGNGKLLREPHGKGKGITLESWLEKTKQSSNRNWWMKSSDPGTSYFALSKDDFPPLAGTQLPFPRDSKGIAHVCQFGSDSYTTSGAEIAFEASSDGTLTGQSKVYRPRVILCPNVFSGDQWRGSITKALPESKQPEKTILDSLATGVLTFYHELFHLQAVLEGKATIRGFPDSLSRRASCERGKDGKCTKALAKKWWSKKSSFSTQGIVFSKHSAAISSSSSAAQTSDKRTNVAGAFAAMYLTLYDLADPISHSFIPQADPTSGVGYAGLFTPENYVWFAYATYLHSKASSDHWSSGYCKKKAETFEESLTPVEGNWYFQVP